MWQILYDATDFLWGTPLMILMVGVGLYLTVRSGFFQFLGCCSARCTQAANTARARTTTSSAWA